MPARILSRFFLAFVLLSTTAHAQLFRAYLASDGSDANPCTLAQPCRLLPAALAAVADGGEIWMLDSANFNTAKVTIGKSVSILAIPGAVGSIVALNGPAIQIDTSGLRIALRNIVIGPVVTVGYGTDGIVLLGASALSVEGCLIANLPGSAINVFGTGTLKVVDSILRNNGVQAVVLQEGAQAAITNTRMLDNGWGVFVGSHVPVTTAASITDSLISGGAEGVNAYAAIAGGSGRVTLSRTTIERTTFALIPHTNDTGTALISLSYSLVTENNYAWNQQGTGSALYSLGNNHFFGNTTSIGSKTNVTPD